MDFHVDFVIGSPFHVINSILSWVLWPVFLLIRHLKAVPNQVASEELDVGASSAYDDRRVASRNMQSDLGFKTGVVIAF